MVIPAEFTAGETFINPYISTGLGQGREFIDGTSDYVLETCETGRFADELFVEEWDDPFTEVIILVDDWDF